MLICNKRSRFRDNIIDIEADGIKIEQVDTMKYLGLQIDNYLTFDNHTDYVTKKVNQRNRLLWKMRNFITESLARYLYTTLINPIFSYGDFIYDGTSQTNKIKLQTLKNSSLRAVKGVRRDYPTKRLHDELQIDYLHDCRKKSTLKLVYRGVNNQGPPKLNGLFEKYMPNRTLRSEHRQLILPPKVKTALAENDIEYRGSHYWNNTSMALKSSETLDIFKKALKPYGAI